MLPCPNRELLTTEALETGPTLKTLTSTVSFPGWRLADRRFKPWALKMLSSHKPTWVKAGIYQAVLASTYKVMKHRELVLALTERWCNETKSFVFPWGEGSITLEDVMVLLGFSVVGLPVFACLDSYGEEIKKRLVKEWSEIKQGRVITSPIWIDRFMDSNDDGLEHVAFLVCWLCYFVFPLRSYSLYEGVFTIAVHLSCGVKIALAPAVLAHLYSDLRLLKNHIQGYDGTKVITGKVEMSALFKLVQVWTWERFKELRPRPNQLVKGEPRLALWHEKQKKVDDVRRVLDNSNVDSFEWRPYTKLVKNWKFPRFYPEKVMLVPVGPKNDDELASFARFIKVSKLVGIDSVEDYFPDRVASQFGMFQDVPSLVKWNNLSENEAWDHYNKPLDDFILHISSRHALPCVTPMYNEWWKKTFQELKMRVPESGETSEAYDTSFFIAGSKMNRTREDVRNKRRKYMENDWIVIGHCQAQVPSDDNEDDYDNLPISQKARRSKKKYIDVTNSGGDDSEPLGKRSRLLAVMNVSVSAADGYEAVTPPAETEEMNDETIDDVDIVESPPETMQSYDGEVDVYGTNADMNSDSSEEPNVLLLEDNNEDDVGGDSYEEIIHELQVVIASL